MPSQENQEKNPKIFVMQSPALARLFISYLFKKYSSVEGIQSEYTWGLAVVAPAEEDCMDRNVAKGQEIYYLVVAGGAKK
jgi:hypothetical protein